MVSASEAPGWAPRLRAPLHDRPTVALTMRQRDASATSIASRHYRLERAVGRDQDADRLILQDTGNGAVVGRVMMLLTEVIAPAQGAEGRELANASRTDLARHFFEVIDRIKDD